MVTLARPPTHSSLKITNRSFRYAAPSLWNELPTDSELLFVRKHTVFSERRYTALLLTAVLSVRTSVCHTHDSRPNGSRYQNAFAPNDRAIFLVY